MSSLKKTIILGAGATRGASIVNPAMLPPLLMDLPKVATSHLVSLNHSKDGPKLAQGFIELLKLTKTENDIETYLTVLHVLGLISIQVNKKSVFMNDAEIRKVLNSNILENIFKDTKLENMAREILTFFLENKLLSHMNYPLNFQNLFQKSLKDYIYHSLSNCFCHYHEKLFSTLTTDDVVVNFNYDEIADFTLFSSRRLSKQSFDGLPFSKIEFPKAVSTDCTFVKYLKVHGSFNWEMDIDTPNINNYSSVYYNLVSEACGKDSIGNTFFPIILPTLTKEIIYKQYPIFAAHINEFSKSLKNSDTIYLVGKSFKNSDRELNKIIKNQRAGKECDLIVIDPNCADPEFIDYHQNLLNGKCSRMYLTMADYYNDKLYSRQS